MGLVDLLQEYSGDVGIHKLANKQGVACLLLDEIQKKHAEGGETFLEKKELAQLSGFIQKRQGRYHVHKEAMCKLASFFDKYGIGMVVLKGFGLSLNWPSPELRQSGDLDIFLFDKDIDEKVQGKPDSIVTSILKSDMPVWKKADRLIEERLDIKIDDSHEHHTCYSIEGMSVENHYDIVDTKTHRDGKDVDNILKELVLQHVKVADPVLPNIFLPPADFNAIFLMRHMGQDFSSTHTSLRQIYDWAFFMKKHNNEVNWERVLPILENMGIIKFFDLINSICVNQLGFERESFPRIRSNKDVENRFIHELFCPEFSDKQPKGRLIQNIIFKVRRYWKNSWKKKIIFKTNPIVDFFYGCMMHLRRWRTLSE